MFRKISVSKQSISSAFMFFRMLRSCFITNIRYFFCFLRKKSELCGKNRNYAEDADFSELCGSASPHPVRCHGSCDVTVAMLVSPSKGMVAMLVSPTNPPEIELFYHSDVLFWCKNKVTDHVSGNTIQMYTVLLETVCAFASVLTR